MRQDQVPDWIDKLAHALVMDQLDVECSEKHLAPAREYLFRVAHRAELRGSLAGVTIALAKAALAFVEEGAHTDPDCDGCRPLLEAAEAFREAVAYARRGGGGLS